ncbi:MAG: hypothetical protein ACYDH2_17200 [Anaerolineaceae bacterium]
MRIFLSRPTWIPPKYQAGVNTFLTQLENLGLDARTIGVSDHPTRAPLDEVIEILQSCHGAIVLGVPQLEIQQGILKGETIANPLVLGTEWNHLEAGLAYAAGLPLLVIHHHTVTRGIFDRGALNAFLHSVDLESNNWSMQLKLNGAIVHWKENCIQQSGNRMPAFAPAPASSGKPVCPNCSASRPFYLRPIPPDFIAIENASWECSQCGYKE